MKFDLGQIWRTRNGNFAQIDELHEGPGNSVWVATVSVYDNIFCEGEVITRDACRQDGTFSYQLGAMRGHDLMELVVLEDIKIPTIEEGFEI